MTGYPIKDGAGTDIVGTLKSRRGTLGAAAADAHSAGKAAAAGLTAVVMANAQGGPIGISLYNVGAAFNATVDFEKSYDDGVTWITVKQYTAADDEVYDEVEGSVLFRLAVSAWVSGTIGYRLAAR